MPVGAAIGAAGSIGAALIGSDAADSASSKQADAALQGLGVQKEMFGVARNALQPFIDTGSSFLPTLKNLLTPGQSADTLASLPGFQFQSQYGTKAATNALAASGRASGGPLATAVSNYNNGLAGTNYTAYVQQLLAAAGLGGNAAQALAGNALGSGNSQAATLGNFGNAQASGVLGSANALAGGITGATNGVSNALLLNKLGMGGGGGTNGIYGPSPGVGGAPTGFDANGNAFSYGG